VIDSVIFQNHGRNRIILRTDGQSVSSRGPISYYIEKDDKTDLVKVRTERTPNIINFQHETPPNSYVFR
jgi:hypothetical protein